MKLGSSPPARPVHYLGFNLSNDDDYSNEDGVGGEEKKQVTSENDPRAVLTSILEFLNNSNTSRLASLVVVPVIWSGCQTEKILEGMSKYGARLKNLKLPTQGLFSVVSLERSSNRARCLNHHV